MLGQLFLVACGLAALSVAVIVFVVLGPVPVKRKVVIAPRLSVSGPVSTYPMPTLVAQLAPASQSFSQPYPSTFPATIQGAPPIVPARPTPSARMNAPEPPPLPIAETPSPVSMRKPKGQKVQPMPRKRAAKGTAAPSPLAPVVRPRSYYQDDAVTAQVRMFETEELTIDER
ncbi:MAG TPA: hypothetical protein VIV11_04040 [Kofleriaceae bacterium]